MSDKPCPWRTYDNGYNECCAGKSQGGFCDGDCPTRQTWATLVEALEVLSDSRNWFHTADEPGSPITAWRGAGEPDEIAEAALKAAGR